VNGHAYTTYHDADRPLRDEQVAKGGKLSRGDSKDFPQLDGSRQPPSCATQTDGAPVIAPNQQRGTLVETRKDADVCEPQLHGSNEYSSDVSRATRTLRRRCQP